MGCKIPICQVSCDDYVPPDEGALAKLDEVWSEEQKHTLGTYGIFLPMIKEAYRHLATLGAIAFRRFSSSGDQEASIMQVVEWCRLPCHGRLLGRSAGGGGIAQIVIAGNTEDPEAMCVCSSLHTPPSSFANASSSRGT